MLCYRDRSFCSAYGTACHNHGCDRAMTDAETRRVMQWWATFEATSGAPVAYMDMSEGCADIVPDRAFA